MHMMVAHAKKFGVFGGRAEMCSFRKILGPA
jgi:hypothetical protein